MITLPSSEYFNLRPLKVGVYAAIAKEGSPVYSNAGIVDTGDHILIFDTFNTFRAAEDLRRDAEIITRRLVDYVVNSHSHADHWMGNQVFADHAKLLATPKTQDGMLAWAKDFKELQNNPDQCKAYISETEGNLFNAADPRLRAHLTWSLAIERHRHEILTDTDLHVPKNSFTSTLEIYGADALAKLYSLGSGHSRDDVIMALPEERIAFIGDLGFFKTHPFMGDSDPENWIRSLDELLDTNINVFVPGHGPIGSKSDLLALKKYIMTLQWMVTKVVENGGSEEDAVAQPVPEFASDWAGFGRYERSMRFLYHRLVYKDYQIDDNISRTLKS
jgi:glyoxylase-like metal-dependent hydrolase (beta-lactamase superfamily II)